MRYMKYALLMLSALAIVLVVASSGPRSPSALSVSACSFAGYDSHNSLVNTAIACVTPGAGATASPNATGNLTVTGLYPYTLGVPTPSPAPGTGITITGSFPYTIAAAPVPLPTAAYLVGPVHIVAPSPSPTASPPALRLYSYTGQCGGSFGGGGSCSDIQSFYLSDSILGDMRIQGNELEFVFSGGIYFQGNPIYPGFGNTQDLCLNSSGQVVGGSSCSAIAPVFGHNSCSSSSGNPCSTTATCSLSSTSTCTNTAAVPSSSVCSATYDSSSTITPVSDFEPIVIGLSGTTLSVQADTSASLSGNVVMDVTCL